jgi:hypothetical protein
MFQPRAVSLRRMRPRVRQTVYLARKRFRSGADEQLTVESAAIVAIAFHWAYARTLRPGRNAVAGGLKLVVECC